MRAMITTYACCALGFVGCAKSRTSTDQELALAAADVMAKWQDIDDLLCPCLEECVARAPFTPEMASCFLDVSNSEDEFQSYYNALDQYLSSLTTCMEEVEVCEARLRTCSAPPPPLVAHPPPWVDDAWDVCG